MPYNVVIKKDKFLSTILKKDCFLISKKIQKNLTFKKNSFYQLKIKKTDMRQKKILKEKGFKLIEKNFLFFGIYKKKLLNKLPKNFEIKNCKKKFINLPDNLFKFENSRIFKDKKISKNNSLQFKKKWLNNFFKNKRADKLHILKIKKKIIGFLMIIIKDNTAIIDLIKISKKYQKKGFAVQMINEFFLKNKKIKYLKAGTQSDNVSAINFYKTLNLKLIDKFQVYHLHT
jgi:ribosomal protein S18 acetylase RimI-like enzyme